MEKGAHCGTASCAKGNSNLCIKNWGVKRAVDRDEHDASTEDHPDGGGSGFTPRSHPDKLLVTSKGRRVSREGGKMNSSAAQSYGILISFRLGYYDTS